jgi:hypothetical protein
VNAHSDWSPSSGSIWVNCPASVEVSQLYKEEEDSEASELGTVAHGVLEDSLLFGTEPQHENMEIVEGVELAVDWVHEQLRKNPATKLYIEKRLEWPNTPVWGTTDSVLVTDKLLHIADFKFGWLPVNVDHNVQMLIYLIMAIMEFGERDEYHITVIQPRYYHKDGPIRTYRVTGADVAQIQQQVEWALANRGVFSAGRHCKYCKARGACATFAGWIVPRLNTALEYDITDRHTFSNETIAKLLDFLDLVPGYISAVKQEAFRRALNDRRIGGYKLVKGKAERKVTDEDYIRAKYEEWGMPVEALYDASLVSPLGIENQLKARFRGEGRGVWKQRFEELAPAIQKVQGGLTLVRDVDGRPQFNKGDEFGELPLDTNGDILL